MNEEQIPEEIYLQVEQEVRDRLAFFVHTLLMSYSQQMPDEAKATYRDAMAAALKLINGDRERAMRPTEGPWE